MHPNKLHAMNIPPKGKSTGRKPKYNFDKIAVGESAFYEDRRARQAASTYSKHRNGEVKFITRNEDEGIRIYRTK